MRFSSIENGPVVSGERRKVLQRAGTVAVALCALWGTGLTGAKAQNETPTLPSGNTAAGPAAAPAVPAQANAAAAQMGAILGGAEFLTWVDRPFDSEKLAKLALSIDPNNDAAKEALRRAKFMERPTYTLLGHHYRNSYDATLATYGVDVTLRNQYGRVQLLAGNGSFKEFGDSMTKSTLSVIAEPYYKKWEGYLYYGGTYYGGDGKGPAKDRSLYNLKVSYLPAQTRERISLIYARRDSFLQSDQAQFFAPETVPFVQSNYFLYEKGFQAEVPFGPKVDFLPAYSHFDYSDGNDRDIAHAQLLYRVLPAGQKPLPLFRVGFDYNYDSTDHVAPIYYTPVNYSAFSLAANYVMLSRKWRYGVFGTLPLTGKSGSGKDVVDGFGRYGPPRSFFTFVNYSPSDKIELWLKLTDVYSAQKSPSLTDYVQGITFRF